MQFRNKSLQILLAILVILIVIASIVIAKIPGQREVVYYNTSPNFDNDLLMLGVRMSKFGGMSIYMDSPSVLLSKTDRLELSGDQQRGLQDIIDRARQEAVSLLNEEQITRISPISSEPIVLEKMSETTSSCSSGACDVSPVKGAVACCNPDAPTCAGCGLKGSRGCCKTEKGAESASLCGKCGQIKGSGECGNRVCKRPATSLEELRRALPGQQRAVP